MKKQMTNEQILKQAIEKARKNGWNKPIWICGAIGKLGFDMMVMYKLYYVHIFSHGFAKAFWGEEFSKEEWEEYPENVKVPWQYHLQQMVISEDPIKYLEQYL